ncbi:hypothetical protein O4J56_12855 [Nocardiopsis sp. RSe5-2]|uniref:Immunity protein 35 domain-containing protein n=1 Tax=Nocardiopsis endophytica TaxID=3018445 RepID=A0ABT4U3J4_9ACTN|nr:hypothetical protein [Nocardiopsis endophytica]MDA2811523.1 hypothetical protein [Nocardiopsis endophytica]
MNEAIQHEDRTIRADERRRRWRHLRDLQAALKRRGIRTWVQGWEDAIRRDRDDYVWHDGPHPYLTLPVRDTAPDIVVVVDGRDYAWRHSDGLPRRVPVDRLGLAVDRVIGTLITS